MGTKQEAVELAIALAKRFEGLRLYPYKCPAGIWTIGYGTVFKPDGSRVTKDHPAISKELAEAWLRHEMENNYMRGILICSPGLAKYPKILAAMSDFAYNLGTARYRSSTLRRKINEEDWEEAAEQLMKWIRGNGRVLKGLVLRRQTERKLLPDD